MNTPRRTRPVSPLRAHSVKRSINLGVLQRLDKLRHATVKQIFPELDSSDLNLMWPVSLATGKYQWRISDLYGNYLLMSQEPVAAFLESLSGVIQITVARARWDSGGATGSSANRLKSCTIYSWFISQTKYDPPLRHFASRVRDTCPAMAEITRRLDQLVGYYVPYETQLQRIGRQLCS